MVSVPNFVLTADEVAKDLYGAIPVMANSGIDLRFPEDITIPPRGKKATTINMHVRARLWRDERWRAFHVVPRSSTRNGSVILINSPATFDCDYQGYVFLAIYNVDDEPYHIKRGTALFQMVAPDLEAPALDIVTAEDEAFAVPTARGNGAFGSTGVGGVGTPSSEGKSPA
jgi:dUTPase